jgi:hypothetical protein
MRQCRDEEHPDGLKEGLLNVDNCLHIVAFRDRLCLFCISLLLKAWTYIDQIIASKSSPRSKHARHMKQ